MEGEFSIQSPTSADTAHTVEITEAWAATERATWLGRLLHRLR